MITDTISTMTDTGIQLASGKILDADAIITATGLKIKIAGGAKISVDKVPITIGDKFLWKMVMLQDVPNMATVIGYTNASWTLGADVTARLVCRLLKHMKAQGLTATVPWMENSEGLKSMPALNISSTYVVRGKEELPKIGDKAPVCSPKASDT